MVGAIRVRIPAKAAMGMSNAAYRAMPSVEARHHVNGPDTGKNSGGRLIKKGPLEGTG